MNGQPPGHTMRIAFSAANNALAQQCFTDLVKKYGQASVKEADIIVVLGGDGHVLNTLYHIIDHQKPVFAIRRTESVGFLCNDFLDRDLPERIAKAQRVTLHPLAIAVTKTDGSIETALAINEASILRETMQAARLRISVDGVERIAQYSGDGVLVATPAGSTAYNHSCGGPIMPLDANTLVMTAISGYRPRRWSYAVLPQDSQIEIETLEITKRPVRIEAGEKVIRDAQSVKIHMDRSKSLTLLFDPDQHLGERIIREQFML